MTCRHVSSHVCAYIMQKSMITETMHQISFSLQLVFLCNEMGIIKTTIIQMSEVNAYEPFQTFSGFLSHPRLIFVIVRL